MTNIINSKSCENDISILPAKFYVKLTYNSKIKPLAVREKLKTVVEITKKSIESQSKSRTAFKLMAAA